MPRRKTMVGDARTLATSFERYLRATNRSPRTVEAYLEAVEQFARFLDRQELPSVVTRIRREHVEAYMQAVLAPWKPSTASNRFRSLQQFFKYLVDEGELDASPMATMTPPQVPDQPVPVLGEDDLKNLLADCSGSAFEDRGDQALIRLLVDTGMRRGELLGMRVEDLDLDQQVAFVLGKGRRDRACPFGRKAALALDRYLRARARHPRRGRLNE